MALGHLCQLSSTERSYYLSVRFQYYFIVSNEPFLGKNDLQKMKNSAECLEEVRYMYIYHKDIIFLRGA